jgi:hypothetical protein
MEDPDQMIGDAIASVYQGFPEAGLELINEAGLENQSEFYTARWIVALLPLTSSSSPQF